MNQIINHFFSNPIKIIVLVTFVYAIYQLRWKKSDYKFLIVILIISLLTEVINSGLIVHGYPTGLSTTMGMFFFNITWLLLLSHYVYYINLFKILIISFFAFFIINIIFIEGSEKFNYYSFVIGAFTYVFIIIYESFYQLKKENFNYFLSNNYLLIFSPVILLLGFSFMFCFGTKIITSSIILGKIKLYDVIMYFVNIIYYTLINIYIYREKKLKHA